jgi:hypothetical protein
LTALSHRVKQVRARARVRRWEYRQRHTSHGAWYRFRRALGFAERAYVITDAQARSLIGAGATVDVGGRDLEPPRTLVWIRRDQVAELESAQPLVLRLGPALLEPRWIALVPFDDLGPPGPPP